MAMAKKIKKPTMPSQRYLSDDIIFEILHRLPVNSVLRFTSVSKSWKASIKSSSFISAHHHHHIDNNINYKKSCSHLVYVKNPFGDSVRDFTLVPETSDGVRTQTQISLPRSSCKAWIVGSCEGLICLRTGSIIYIWNPFTIRLKRVPNSKISVTLKSNGGYNRSCILGFGFAPKSCDYRVVKLLCEKDYIIEVEIYSLATDSWRRIKPPSSFTRCNPECDGSGICFNGYINKYYGLGVCFKGSIYWMILSLGYGVNGSFNFILRFDMEEERFEQIHVPFLPRLILVSNGFLVALKFEPGINHVEAYIKEESELESESSSWAVKSVDLPEEIKMMKMMNMSTSGCIIFRGEDNKILACDCYCAGNYLSFKLRDLGINSMESGFCLISITKTLLLLDKGLRSTRY